MHLWRSLTQYINVLRQANVKFHHKNMQGLEIRANRFLTRNCSANMDTTMLFLELRRPLDSQQECVTEVEYGVITRHVLSIKALSAKIVHPLKPD